MPCVKTVIVAGIIFAFILWPALCGAKDVGPSYGGTLVWGTTNPPGIINPILSNQGVSSAIFSLIFDSLLRVDGKGDIIPGLALSWDKSVDGLSYVFHLKQGVRFHDDVELTAEDVKFTYEAIINPNNASPRKDGMGVLKEASWDVIDKYTIKLSLTRVQPHVLFKLLCEIVPKHILENKNMAEVPFNTSPVGTGSFRFKGWDQKLQEITLEANRNYFGGRPYLDRIVVKVYPDNTSLWAGLMRQEVDFVKFLNREDYEVLSKDPLFKTYEISAGTSMAIVFDVKDPVLMDIRVRRAIARALDVDRMMGAMQVGGVPSMGIFSPHTLGFNSEISPLVYDPWAARHLLEEAGWRVAQGSHVLEKDGMALEIRMLVDARRGYFETASMIMRQRLAEIGIRLVVIPYNDEKEFTVDFLSKQRPQAWLRLFFMYDKDPGLALEQWYPSGDSLQSLWNYHNSQLDQLMDKVKSVSDDAGKGTLYREIHKIIYDDQPACFLFSLVTRHALARKFSNTDGFFFPLMPAYMMKDWYLQSGFRGKNER